METKLPIQIRPINQLDVGFLFNSWLKSFRGAFFVKDIHPKTYYGLHHKVIGSLLQTADTMVACDPNDSTQIYGFICAEQLQGSLVVHYIYVKHTYRNLGIANLLLQQFKVSDNGISFYTHHNHVSHKLAAAYSFLYNPYLALLPEYRANKKSHNLDLNTKVQEHSDDEQEFKRHRSRRATPVNGSASPDPTEESN